jgi:hypothetical protein
MELTIELYKVNDEFFAYVGEDNASGYEISAPTKEECLNKLADYLNDVWEG